MPSKRRYLRYSDLPAGGGAPRGTNSSDDVAVSIGTPAGAPLNVVLSSGVIYSSAAPAAYIAIDFDPPESIAAQRPDRYTIQVSTNSTFTASGTITTEVAPSDPDAPIVRVDGLAPNTLYYVRLRAIVSGYPGAWTSMSPLTDNVNRITTAQDTTAAAQPTSLAVAWVGTGDLLITWTNPTSLNWMNNQLTIKASSGGATLRTVDTAATAFLYTFSMNYADTSAAPDNNLYVEIRSRTFSAVLNNASVPNATSGAKAAPALPTGFAQSWSGDTGTAGADLILSWTAATDAAYYTLTLNGTARRVGANRYTYTLDANKAENAGTADPTITYSLVANDSFGTASTAVSGTATNAAPPTPTVTLTAGFSILIATVGGTIAADFAAYEYVWKRDATTVRTLESAAAEQQYEMSGASDGGYHSWTCVVRQKDAFAQYSSTVTSAAAALETLTLAGLRAGISYSDSISTAAATLKTAMADDVRDSGGVSYNA